MLDQYEVQTSKEFDVWIGGIKDFVTRKRIVQRLRRMTRGNFGDFKNLGGRLYELRLDFGPGYRVFYTIQHRKIILVLVGGDKSSQSKDIDRARNLIESMK